MTTDNAAPPLSIFIVENHPDTLEYLQLYLEQRGHRVETATSLEEALQKLAVSHCDVLISDIGLPDGDGWALLRRFKPEHPPYAIAMSGFGMAADLEKSRAAGYRHHVLKPFALTDLDSMLAEAARELGR